MLISEEIHKVDANPDADSIDTTPDSLLLSVQRKQLLEDTFDIVPVGLTFCFDREQFLNDNFESDEFIVEQYHRAISLEKLRDNLLQYSNILKSSLIELINQDYADFVSLSTHLVGLDKTIHLIASPLKNLQSTVLSISSELEEINENLLSKLQALRQLRNKRDLVQSLHTLEACVSRLERWLSPPNTSFVNKRELRNDTELIDEQLDELDKWPSELYADCSLHEDIGQCMDRVANEYIKLQFFAKICRDHTILQSMKPRIHWITSTLQEQLEARLKSCFEACHLTTDCENYNITKHPAGQLRQVLSIYLAIDKLPDLMLLYRHHVLRTRLSEIFAPRFEITHTGSDLTVAVQILESIYSKAIQLLDTQNTLLNRNIIQCSVESSDPLSEFNWLVEGFWPEIVEQMSQNLPELFAPGNPDRFYAFYTTTLQFVKTIESRINSSKQLIALHKHSAYKTFINKWSLPVYFQIRFQEIAGNCESSMKSDLVLIKDSKASCLIETTEVIIHQLNRCWTDGIYIDNLKHRFWKLTLQIISRYTNFIDAHIKSLQENNSAISTVSNSVPIHSNTFPEQYICLLVDLFRLTDHIRSDLKATIFNLLDRHISSAVGDSKNYQTLLNDCLNESCERLLESGAELNEAIANCIQACSSNIIRHVMDIPRQYRRTNRDYPNSPSPYVSDLIKLITKLVELGSELSQSIPTAKSSLVRLISQSTTKINLLYYNQLSSVRKMEDSLRRLREVRRGIHLNNQVQTTTTSYSDDDKIRHQIDLDASAFRDQVAKLWGMDSECLKELERSSELFSTNKSDNIT